jgi:hypothetical protein
MRKIALLSCLVLASSAFTNAAVAKHAHHKHAHYRTLSAQDRAPAPAVESLMSVAAFFDGPLSKDFDGLPTSASRAL